MGEWIEMTEHEVGKSRDVVSPFMGEWIEIALGHKRSATSYRLTLHG